MRRGTEHGRAIVHDLCREAEAARQSRGTSYADLGRALGVSGGQVARICRGQSPDLSIVRASQLLAVTGLELSARAFPTGVRLRDRGQLRLLGRLRARVHPSLGWHIEAPVVELPTAGRPDLRAWDVAIEGAGWVVGVDAETRVGDLQAVVRRVTLKARDGAVDGVILLLAETRHHRRLLDETSVDLRAKLAVSPRQALASLRLGRRPGGSAIVLL